jgi:hypothetical protein
MRLRTDGIRRTKFREIILTDRVKGYVKGIFWAHTPEEARHFAKLMRSLQFRVTIRRATDDQHINYVLLNWQHV